MPPQISKSLEYNIEQYIIRGDTTKDITARCGIGEERIRWMRRNLRDFGACRPPQMKRGRPRAMDEEMEDALLAFMDAKKDAYLYEMAFFLYDTFDEFEISEQALSDNLERLKITRKKVFPHPYLPGSI